jgi:cytochrome P450
MLTSDAIFDPLDPDVVRDPYPTYRRLRETHPVYWHDALSSWVLTRYADCAYVLGDADLFAADFRRVGVPTPPPILSLQTLDPPEQTPLRQFATAAVRAQDLGALEDDAVRRAAELLRPLDSGAPFDFVRDFTDPFTLGTICKLVGIDPPARDEHWARLNDDLDRSMDAKLVPDSEATGLAARAAFSALVGTWLADEPRAGILGYVAVNRAQADVTDDVLQNSVRAFWHAGFEVPSRFLGNALLALLRDAAAMARLRSARSLDLAIEELVRYVGPVHALSRACTRRTSLGGATIEAGDVVVALIAAGNRDPLQFDDSEELVLDRNPNPHLGFGKGAHSCLGSFVARMEARVALGAIVRGYSELGLDGDPVQRVNATLRGPASLPVSLGVRSTA